MPQIRTFIFEDLRTPWSLGVKIAPPVARIPLPVKPALSLTWAVL